MSEVVLTPRAIVRVLHDSRENSITIKHEKHNALDFRFALHLAECLLYGWPNTSVYMQVDGDEFRQPCRLSNHAESIRRLDRIKKLERAIENVFADLAMANCYNSAEGKPGVDSDTIIKILEPLRNVWEEKGE